MFNSGKNVPRAICFDAFGTLVQIDKKRHPYRRVLDALSEPARKELAPQLMRKDFQFEEVLKIAKIGQDNPLYQSLLRDLAEEQSSINMRPKTANILSQILKENIPIGLCSNLATPYASPLLSALSKNVREALENTTVFSFEVGYQKPEPQIYQIVCDKFQLEPKDVLFVGDSIQNDVEGPAAFGMSSRSIHDFETDFVKASCADEDKA